MRPVFLVLMRPVFNGCLAGLAMLTLGGTAHASVLTAELDRVAPGITLPSGFTSAGTVTATDKSDANGIYVDVLVTLNNGALFINTGGPHTPFAYNLDKPTFATIVTPAPVPGASGNHPNPAPVPGFIGAVGPQDATPFGTFSNGIAYVIEKPLINPIVSDAPNGGGHGLGGPLEFRLYGVTTADFVDNNPNGPGYFFAADLIACTGAGTRCTTGSFAADDVITTTTHQSAVPEPSTWAMMILGFAGVGFMAYRRSRKDQGLARAAA
jgi:hypothetical protein